MPASVPLSPPAVSVQVVRTFMAPTFFTFHYVNLHEAMVTGSRVLHLDMCMFRDPQVR